MSAIRPYEPASTHWDTARERDVDKQLDAEERGLDSREKLEADVQKHFTHSTSTLMWPSSANKTTDWLSVSMETVLGWLDRQAAITEQEYIDQRIADQIGSIWKGEKVRKLRATLDELTDERDGLRRQVELKDDIIEGLRQSLDETIEERNALQAQVDELTKERDRALADAKTQRNNFEIATKAREHWRELATKSKGEVDDLRQSLDETIEERNELQAKLDDFDGDCYCGAAVVQWYEHSVRLQGRLDEMEQTRMCLPVDAGGVPCRIGDVLDCDGGRHEVMAVSDDCVWFDTDAHEVRLTCCESRECRHVQPDTVESLLEEFHGKLWSDDEEQMALLEEYAERIRKAVEQ